MKLDLSSVPGPDRGFMHRHQDGMILIAPAKGQMMNQSDWQDTDVMFRSMVVRADTGEVVSVGFPKFWNYSERPAHTDQLNELLDAGADIRWCEKHDGSLAIRSVIDGQVIFRTRGTLTGGDHGPHMHATAARRYPILLDPSFQPESSLLFEFVSPDFRIVLPYEQDDLILLGAVRHHDLTLWHDDQLETLAADHGLRLVERHELPADLDDLLAAVKDWQASEGVVARTPCNTLLVKIKSADYLARHRLRFALTAKVIRQVCVDRDVQEVEDFGAFLAELNADWEIATEARPLVQTYVSTLKATRELFEQFAAEVAGKLKEFPVRKDFAVRYAKDLPGARRTAAFLLADGNTDKAFGVLRDQQLDIAFSSFEARDVALNDD